jgi:3-isopropylmalate/(R)-2-methylmalate dehydratase large subunit
MKAVEKLLANASGQPCVAPGDVVIANVDRLLMHDLSTYLTARVFEEKVGGRIKYPDRVTVVFDHNFCPANLTQANALRYSREWADKHGVRVFDCGSGNIHNVAAQWVGIKPGMVVVGSDSHTGVHGVVGAFATSLGNDSHAGTVLRYGKAWFRVPQSALVLFEGETRPGTTPRDLALWFVGEVGEGGARYLALEFDGSYFRALPFWDRWLFTLAAVDVGAKSAFVRPDRVTLDHLWSRSVAYDLDSLADGAPREEYDDVRTWDVQEIGPQVACPPTVGNVKPVENVAGTPLDWAELGGHGGARLEDIRLAVGLMEGRRKHPSIRFNIVPATREIFSTALDNGWVSALHDAGATWFPPSTGSNQGINMGVMSAGESMISTHSRNFPGRNGSPEANMYLASALTVTASAIAGCIADPRDMIAPQQQLLAAGGAT